MRIQDIGRETDSFTYLKACLTKISNYRQWCSLNCGKSTKLIRSRVTNDKQLEMEDR